MSSVIETKSNNSSMMKTKEEESSNPGTPDPNSKKMNPVVFYGSAIIIISFTIWSFAYPRTVESLLGITVAWVTDTLGWFYLLTATLALLFVIVVAWGKSGKIKLGPDHSKPRYNIFTWTSMLFAAGIGIDLLFFSVS